MYFPKTVTDHYLFIFFCNPGDTYLNTYTNFSNQLSNDFAIRQIVHLALIGVTYYGTEVKIHLLTESGFCFLQLGPIMT